MKNMDTLQYCIALYIRIIRLEEMLGKEISDVQRRDIIVRRNEYLNEVIRVLEIECNFVVAKPVRFLKLNIEKEMVAVKKAIVNMKAAQEGMKNAKAN